MKKIRRTRAADVLTSVMLDLFRLNSLLLTSGDRLVSTLGLTSARWQILGAMVGGQRSLPVAWIARDLGVNRQNVQRIINDLNHEGLVAFEPNPYHRRAQLVSVTDKGRQIFDAAMDLQIPWVNRLSQGLTAKELEAAHRAIISLRQNIEANK